MTPILEARRLNAFYDEAQVLHEISFAIAPGGITTILGANGAGKTTLLRAVSRMVRTTGELLFDGRSIARMATEDVVRLGIAHAPEGRGTFGDLTVEENLKLGAWGRRDRAGAPADMKRMYRYFPRLHERSRSAAGTLSGGEQQMLAIARALMLAPRLLLLDEPSLGLAPLVVRDIFGILRTVALETGVAILLVEQNAALALELADHVFLLETGRIMVEGPSTVLRENEAVRRAYLGY